MFFFVLRGKAIISAKGEIDHSNGNGCKADPFGERMRVTRLVLLVLRPSTLGFTLAIRMTGFLQVFIRLVYIIYPH